MKTIALIFSVWIIFMVSMVLPPLKAEAQSEQASQYLSASKPLPPPLIATEEEVRQFFATYIERYNGKDLDGFLSLFSSNAIENQKNGLDGIRKVYANFFEQSQEIRYHMDDLKMEIYQNGVLIKASYEVDQTLKNGGEKKTWKGPIRWTLVKESGALKILSLDYQY